ncbi:MAG: exodeoxyribonuclease V subunit gamma, partial [Myxococcota bacterium]
MDQARLRLCYSNRIEMLLGRLAERIDIQARASPLTPISIVVPNRITQRYVEAGVAERLGLAANLRFMGVRAFLQERSRPHPHTRELLSEATLRLRLIYALAEEQLLSLPELALVQRYLDGNGTRRSDSWSAQAADVRRVDLASRLARLFIEYDDARPELLASWRAGRSVDPKSEVEAFQRRLFQEVCPPNAMTLREAIEVFRRERDDPSALPVCVFGFSYLSQSTTWALAVLARVCPVYLFALNPCREYWEDLPVEREQPRAEANLSFALLDQAGPAPSDPLALTLWSRPGRDYIRWLNELTDCEFEPCFVDARPDRRAAVDSSLQAGRGLRDLQQEILDRHPHQPTGREDGSVRVFACSSIRREAEVVASEIWRLISADSQLRFNQVAVMVAGSDRERYFTHLEAAFAEEPAIPSCVTDVPLSHGSRLVEAALELLRLPLSRVTRKTMLSVLLHPSIRGRYEASAEVWSQLVDRLGAFHGIDREDLRESYLFRDVYNWDQAVRRLALGFAFPPDEECFALDGERYLLESPGDDPKVALELAALVRSLLSDVQYCRDSELPLSRWTLFFEGLFSHLSPQDSDEQRHLQRVLGCVQQLRDALDLATQTPAPPVRLDAPPAHLDAEAGQDPSSFGGGFELKGGPELQGDSGHDERVGALGDSDSTMRYAVAAELLIQRIS